MCGSLQEELCFSCTAPIFHSYWTARYNWADDTHQLLDQSSADCSISRLDSANLTRIQKLRCGWLPVNRGLSREDPDGTAGCAACRPVVDHVPQCPSPLRRGLLIERLSSFTVTLRERKSPPIFCQILSAATHHWILTRWDNFEFHVPEDTPSLQLVLFAIEAGGSCLEDSCPRTGDGSKTPSLPKALALEASSTQANTGHSSYSPGPSTPFVSLGFNGT